MIFFLPLFVHILAGFACVISGIVAFCVPKRRGLHPWWGGVYLCVYCLVFLTTTILSFERWPQDASLFFAGLVASCLALVGYGAGRLRRDRRIAIPLRKRWVSLHILAMVGSYVGLLTAFLLDNAHDIAFVNRLPTLSLWFLPGAIGLSFLMYSLRRYAPHRKKGRTARGSIWETDALETP